MKPAGLLPLFSAGLVAIAAAEETASGLASREIKAHIRASLPTYQPTPPKADDNSADSTAVTAPAVFVLPKMIVREVRLPKDADDHLMSKRDFKRKMENLYLDTLAEAGPLNVILNSHALPILNKISIPIPPRRGQPLYRSVEGERGRAIYRAQEIERLGHVTEVRGQPEREGAPKFKQEIDNTTTTRPAGIK